MTSDTRGVPLRHPDQVDDPLTAGLRNGARRLLAQAVEAEAEAFLAEMRGLRLPSDSREERHVAGRGRVPQRRLRSQDYQEEAALCSWRHWRDSSPVIRLVLAPSLWHEGRTDFVRQVGMAQHFLLSAAARSLSAAKVMRMSDGGVVNVFLRLRWPETDGKPVCPGCGGMIVTVAGSPPRGTAACAANWLLWIGHGGESMGSAGDSAMYQHRHEGGAYRRIELITGVARRRRWTAAEKAALVAESLEPGVNISALARRR